MRTAFFRTLSELAEKDDRINLIVGDLGFGAVEPFAARFPTRFLNVGVAEQNMTGIAAGMALNGKVVFTYSIANFPTLRCLEQIRNDICYHNVNVKIVAVGGGFAYGSLGMTHHAIEDLAIMRALPGMIVTAPGDPVETELIIRAVVAEPGSCYVRLGRAGEPTIHTSVNGFTLGRALTVCEGEDLTLISTGGMLDIAVQSARRLLSEGISARVLSMHTIKPLDVESVLDATRATRAVVTIEKHSIVGGLGGAVAEALADSGAMHVPIKRLGIPSAVSSHLGSQEYLRSLYGLTVDGILQSLKSIVDLVRK